MILTGMEILKNVREGKIEITPFSEKQINPNSYNIRLHESLLRYVNGHLDMKKKPETEEIKIPDEGLMLYPGELYLGRTVEKTFTKHFVPMIEGRSSVGRLGMFIHITAGFGDVGFNGFWTLEVTCIQPVKIYPFAEVGQLFFHTPLGDITYYDEGKYQHNSGIQGSKMYLDFKE